MSVWRRWQSTLIPAILSQREVEFMEGFEWGASRGRVGGRWGAKAYGAVWTEARHKTALTLHQSCCHKAKHHFALPKNKSDLFKRAENRENHFEEPSKRFSHCVWVIKLTFYLKHNKTDKIINMCMKWSEVKVTHVWLFATPWTIQSMESSRSEY